MITKHEIIWNTIGAIYPMKSATEYRVAAATLTAIYGPKGHKKMVQFTAVVDLDYRPMVSARDPSVMMVKAATQYSDRFKVLPVVFVDFTKWTDKYGGQHHLDQVENWVFENYMPHSEGDELYDATLLDDQMTSIVIQARAVGKVDESDADIEDRCREEAEAREDEENWCREMYEAHCVAQLGV